MSWPAALRSSHRRVTALFVGAELVLALSIPFLAIAGYHTLLDSHAGRFVEQPTERDPGWRAVVEPTPLTAVVEITSGHLTGIALVASHPSNSAANVILVPATLVVDGQSLDAQPTGDAIATIEAVLRLKVSATEEVDEARWARVLGPTTYQVENPDPVTAPGGDLAVGPLEVTAANVEAFLGRPAPKADPITLLFRRRLFWTALLADPPSGSDPFAAWLATVAGPAAQVAELPWSDRGSGPMVDEDKAEALIRDFIPVPAGPQPGDRTQVRVLDRTGTADLPAVAAEVAAAGLEVVEIGNAVEFDGGPTSLVVPAGLDDRALIELATRTGAATVVDSDTDADPVVTLLVGGDFARPTSLGAPTEQRPGAAAVGPSGGSGRR